MGIKLEGVLASVQDIRNGVSSKTQKPWRMAEIKVLVAKEDGSNSDQYVVGLTNEFSDEQFLGLRKLILSPVVIDVDAMSTYNNAIKMTGYLNIKNPAIATNSKPAASGQNA
jgi:hypothetical protein